MKKEIIEHLGKEQSTRVEKQAKARGMGDDIFTTAAAQAQRELPGAEKPALVERAAIRVQQMVGLVPCPGQPAAEGQVKGPGEKGKTPRPPAPDTRPSSKDRDTKPTAAPLPPQVG